MSRQPHQPAVINVAPGPMPENHALAAAETELREITENTLKLADRLGYDGPLTLGGAEDHARGQMRRTVNECLELGKTLLIIKELTPHGGFRDRVELLGLDYRTAGRFMQATLKFSKASSTTLLGAVGGQTKLLELLVLDDDEIKELSENGSTRGIKLDEIETMTAREVRAALRKAREDAASDLTAKDKFIATQAEQLQKLHKEVATAERRQADFTDIEKKGYECAPLHQVVAETIVSLKKMEREVARLTQEVGGQLILEECYTAVLVAIKRASDINDQYQLGIKLEDLLMGLEDYEMRALGVQQEALQ